LITGNNKLKYIWYRLFCQLTELTFLFSILLLIHYSHLLVSSKLNLSLSFHHLAHISDSLFVTL